MAFDFKSGFNKFAEMGNSVNHAVNKAIGKDVFQDIRSIEDKREFPDYSSFPGYSAQEPEAWTPQNSSEIEYSIQGNVIKITAALDLCMKYRKQFSVCAQYYADQLKYKFDLCATDFDAFLNYFEPMYEEGLSSMLNRAYSLFLPLGIFDSDLETFTNAHINKYNEAYSYFQNVAGEEAERNAKAAQAGNLVGNSVRMQGGGFGLKGAMKGVAKAEAFNIGLSALGAYVAHQTSMSQEDKAKVWATFDKNGFFEAAKRDYENTFFTLIQFLSDKSLIGEVTTEISKETETIYNNLQNPMFPADQFVPTAVKIINRNPFVADFYKILENKIGQNDDINNVKSYFLDWE